MRFLTCLRSHESCLTSKTSRDPCSCPTKGTIQDTHIQTIRKCHFPPPFVSSPLFRTYWNTKWLISPSVWNLLRPALSGTWRAWRRNFENGDRRTTTLTIGLDKQYIFIGHLIFVVRRNVEPDRKTVRKGRVVVDVRGQNPITGIRHIPVAIARWYIRDDYRKGPISRFSIQSLQGGGGGVLSFSCPHIIIPNVVDWNFI